MKLQYNLDDIAYYGVTLSYRMFVDNYGKTRILVLDYGCMDIIVKIYYPKPYITYDGYITPLDIIKLL